MIEKCQSWGRGDADFDQKEGDTCAGDRRETAWLEQKEEGSVSYLAQNIKTLPPGQNLAGKEKAA